MAKQLFVKLQAPTIELKVQAEDSSGLGAEMFVGFKRYNIDDAQVKLEEYKDSFSSSDEDAPIKFIKKQIVYIKGATLEMYDDDKLVETIAVTDTRTAKPLESFWGSPEECLAVLLDYYFQSLPWKNSFFNAINKALLNVDIKDGAIKN